jgi:signal transduction histidine kinase
MKNDIPSEICEKWQILIDDIAKIMVVPAALIMQIKDPYIQVLLSSKTENNPFKSGDKEFVTLPQLYCGKVIKDDKMLVVPNALLDKEWQNNPDLKYNMVSYIGLPIHKPDGSIFGTICVLDTKTNDYSELYKQLLLNIRDSIEKDILIHNNNLEIMATYKNLQTRNEIMKTIFENMDAIIYVIDIETYEVLFINQSGINNVGDATGKICWKSIQKGQAGPCSFCSIDKLLDKDGKSTGIYNWENQNTLNERWYDCRDIVIQWIDGKLAKLGLATDITDRKLAEENLKIFKKAIEISNDPIMINISTKQTYFNCSFYELFGRKEFNLESIFVDKKTANSVLENIKNGIDFTQEIEMYDIDKNIKNIILRTYSIKTEKKLPSVVSVFTDITEFKLKKELEKANNDLKISNLELKNALQEKDIIYNKLIKNQEKLVESSKLASIGTLVAGVAHEINNPNTFIALNAPLLSKYFFHLKELLINDYKEDYNFGKIKLSDIIKNIDKLILDIISGSDRITNIVNSLKDYSVEKKHTFKEHYSIKNIIENAYLICGAFIRRRTPNINFNIKDNVELLCEHIKLEQVIMNLLINASESFIDSISGIINIETNLNNNNEIEIIISDNGIGIPENNLNNIFDPFFSTKNDIGGLGLGLFIAYGIIKEHNGTIEVESKVGEGATFKIILPITTF